MPDVTVKVTLGNFSVEVTGSSNYADKKLEELLGRYLGSAKPASGGAHQVPSTLSGRGDKKLTVAEFVKKVSPKKHTDLAMLLGYYVEKFESQTSFTTTELGKMSRDVKRPFGNISDTVAKLASGGLIMSAEDKEGQRAYALTASGEEFGESILEA